MIHPPERTTAMRKTITARTSASLVAAAAQPTNTNLTY